MNGFFKMMLATVAGVLLSGVLLLVVMLVIGLSSMSDGPQVKPCSVLVLDVREVDMEERASADNPYAWLRNGKMPRSIGLNDWCNVLKAAAEDPNINGVSLELGSLQTSPATLEAMRKALLKFRESGKFVYAYGIGLTQGEYYLATAADSIYLHPQGSLLFKGLTSQVLYFKDMMDKWGVDMQVVRHGTFKSAVEPFISNRMSVDNRLQISEYLQSIWGTMCRDISRSRGIDRKILNAVADNLMLYDNPQAALSTRFVDGLVYEDTYRTLLKLRTERLDTNKVHEVTFADYRKKAALEKTAPYKVAVVYAVGNIVDGEASSDGIGEEFLETLRKVRRDKSVKAVVLRVNSGGGSALMSERIWREICLLKKDRPVVVSMGDVAASGGYYIACAADCIVAEATTITGSIGVFGMFANVGKTLSQKLGVCAESVNTNQSSDWISSLRPMTMSEYEVMQQSVDRVYDTFVRRVADGRHLGVQYVDRIAQGRVWTGKDAVSRGLVDTLGGLDVAVSIAASQAKLAKYSIMERPVMESMFERIMSSLSKEVRMKSALSQSVPEILQPYYAMEKGLRESRGIQARLPYIISIQ